MTTLASLCHHLQKHPAWEKNFGVAVQLLEVELEALLSLQPVAADVQVSGAVDRVACGQVVEGN
jgi:hypothetical protein